MNKVEDENGSQWFKLCNERETYDIFKYTNIHSFFFFFFSLSLYCSIFSKWLVRPTKFSKRLPLVALATSEDWH